MFASRSQRVQGRWQIFENYERSQARAASRTHCLSGSWAIPFHTMTIRIDSNFLEELIALYIIAGLCTGVIVVIWNVLKAVLKLVGWIFLRAEGLKDLEELRIRSETRHAEWVKNQIARGRPATLGGVLKLLGRRIWTAYRHPILAWRGDLDRPKQGTTDAGANRP